MDIKQITPFLSVSSQLSVSDPGIAPARGFLTIINNRPDGQAHDQPDSDVLAAVRKQAPTVAVNASAVLSGAVPMADYDGYASCPLTAERGKTVLAGFAYGGKLLPPPYFDAMLKGREWLAGPGVLSHRPASHEAQEACQTQPSRHA
ncbi:MAG: hypothetical protein HKO62_04850 [Gammaproteobacteria bacterium]|nr:hypothetical protein [Gammaproteobacteria bacterium]